MLNRKEITAIAIIGLILAFSISLMRSVELFLYTLVAILLVIVINIAAKKIIAYYYESEIETKIWEFKRYGYKANWHFKKPIPIGGFLPLISTVLTFGYITWMASLVFEVKPKIYRAVKRHGLYSYSEMTERHIGFIAAAGIFANLIFAVVGYLTGFEEFAKFNIYYAFFNMLPIANLDGNKIYFGNVVFWSFLAAIVLIGLGYVFLIV